MPTHHTTLTAADSAAGRPQAPADARAAALRPPGLAATKLYPRLVDAGPVQGADPAPPADGTPEAGGEADAWQRLPKGIGLGVLLALPLWLLLLALAGWLLR